jgi:hypothetical protein
MKLKQLWHSSSTIPEGKLILYVKKYEIQDLYYRYFIVKFVNTKQDSIWST